MIALFRKYTFFSSLLLEDSEEEEGDLCRICQMAAASSSNLLIEPCKCTGSLQYVHQECMKKWLQAKINSGKIYPFVHFVFTVFSKKCMHVCISVNKLIIIYSDLYSYNKLLYSYNKLIIIYSNLYSYQKCQSFCEAKTLKH